MCWDTTILGYFYFKSIGTLSGGLIRKIEKMLNKIY